MPTLRSARLLVLSVLLGGGCQWIAGFSSEPGAVEDGVDGSRLDAAADRGADRADASAADTADAPAADAADALSVDADAAPADGAPLGPECSDGWCWINPWPQGAELRGVWGRLGVIYVVGGVGTVLAVDGAGVHRIGAPDTTATLTSISGVGTTLYVGGTDGAVFRRQGGFWAKLDPPDFDVVWSVWAASSVDAIAVGGDLGAPTGEVVYYNGGSKTTVATVGGDPHAVWGASLQDFWVGDATGSLWRCKADDTCVFHADVGKPIFGIHGTGAADVFAVGDDGLIAHFDGSGWDQSMSNGAFQHLRAVWARSPSDVWASGQNAYVVHYDGTSWGVEASDPWGTSGDLYGIGGNAGSVIAVGTHGTAARVDPSWQDLTTGLFHDFYDIWAASPTDIHIVGAHATESRWVAMRYDGQNLTEEALPGGGSMLYAVWGTGPSHAVAAGYNASGHAVLLHDGSAWQELATSPGGAAQGVWASSPSDLFATSGTATHHYDGAVWSSHAHGSPVYGVWGSGPSDVWVVGTSHLDHFDGTAWASTFFPGSFLAVWGVDASRVFAVGVDTAAAFDGTDWAGQLGITGSLNAVGGCAVDDVVAVGSSLGGLPPQPRRKSAAYRHDSGWTTITLPSTSDLRGAWCTGGELFVVGSGGAFLRRAP